MNLAQILLAVSAFGVVSGSPVDRLSVPGPLSVNSTTLSSTSDAGTTTCWTPSLPSTTSTITSYFDPSPTDTRITVTSTATNSQVTITDHPTGPRTTTIYSTTDPRETITDHTTGPRTTTTYTLPDSRTTTYDITTNRVPLSSSTGSVRTTFTLTL